MALIGQRKVEILGKPIGFEITFFETGAAFEYSAFENFRIGIDARCQPAEDVVLLHDAQQKLKR